MNLIEYFVYELRISAHYLLLFNITQAELKYLFYVLNKTTLDDLVVCFVSIYFLLKTVNVQEFQFIHTQTLNLHKIIIGLIIVCL